MSIDLSDWTVKIRHDGLALFPPEGKEAGAVRLRSRVRPLARFTDIIGPELDENPQLENIRLDGAEHFMTDDGEFAAMAVIRSNARGKPDHPVEHAVAAIYGDDFYQRYDSICQVPERFGAMRHAMRTLARQSSLGLGALRWRRFLYTPPAGWQPLVRNLTTEWFPLEYPERNCRIVIPPAYASQDPKLLDRAVTSYNEPRITFSSQTGPIQIATRSLNGHVTRMSGQTPDGRELIYEHVLFHDGTFSYIARLECSARIYRESHRVFEEVTESFVPLPVAGKDNDGLVHWAT